MHCQCKLVLHSRPIRNENWVVIFRNCNLYLHGKIMRIYWMTV